MDFLSFFSLGTNILFGAAIYLLFVDKEHSRKNLDKLLLRTKYIRKNLLAEKKSFLKKVQEIENLRKSLNKQEGSKVIGKFYNETSSLENKLGRITTIYFENYEDEQILYEIKKTFLIITYLNLVFGLILFVNLPIGSGNLSINIFSDETARVYSFSWFTIITSAIAYIKIYYSHSKKFRNSYTVSIVCYITLCVLIILSWNLPHFSFFNIIFYIVTLVFICYFSVYLRFTLYTLRHKYKYKKIIRGLKKIVRNQQNSDKIKRVISDNSK